MSWAAWAVETKTGRIGPQIPLLAGSTVTVELNKAGTWTVVTDGGWLDTVPLRWWYPWASSVLICHRAPHDTGWQPWMLGPATEMPAAGMTGRDGETGQPVTLTGKGMRAMLARRIITGPADWRPPDPTWDLQHTSIRYTGMSLGTIADRIIDLAVKRVAGDLPIRYRADLQQTGIGSDDGHARQYDACNLGNNGVDKRLSELSDVIAGPDIMLRPGADWGDDKQPAYAWVTVVHGIESQPQIPQVRFPVWDATRPAGPVLSAEVTVDSSQMWTRRWATGDGQDADILMDVRQADRMLQDGMPLMEDVHSFSSVTAHPTLLQHVDALVAAGQAPTVQWTVHVDCQRPDTAPGMWQVGDRVRAIMPPVRAYARYDEASRQAPYPPAPVDTTMTTIAAKCSLDSETMTVDMQEDASNV